MTEELRLILERLVGLEELTTIIMDRLNEMDTLCPACLDPKPEEDEYDEESQP